MRNILTVFLVCTMILSGCAQQSTNNVISDLEQINTFQVSETVSEANVSDTTVASDETDAFKRQSQSTEQDIAPESFELSDPELLRYVEDNIYSELVAKLNTDEYFVDNISAVYISNEYLEEVAYNSQSNIYFGYTLEELNEQFQDTRYVFTLAADGQTGVEPFEASDDAYKKVLKNVAIGTGVILVCVTASAVSGGIGAPGVSMIFATSAKTGTIFALSSGALSGVATGLITGVQANDFDEALKAGTLAGSESFKWGAILGTLSGGAKGVAQVSRLKGADVTANGLTLQEAAKIQSESKYPLDVIKQMHSMEEYQVYKNVGLKAVMVDGKTALVQNINLDFASELPDGSRVTNLIRMKMGYAPLDPLTGKAYQLHHIGQKTDATLAILTESEHLGNPTILNMIGKETEISRPEFALVRKKFWKYLGNIVFANGGI